MSRPENILTEMICNFEDECKWRALESKELDMAYFWLDRAKSWKEQLYKMEIAPIKEC